MKPGAFYGSLRLVWQGQSSRYLLSQAPSDVFFYCSSSLDLIVPPDQMNTDLGSIPRLLTALLPRDEFANCYVGHDDGYYYQYLLHPKSGKLEDPELVGVRDFACEPDEPTRLAGAKSLFDVVNVNQQRVDYLLSEMIFTHTDGNAAVKRAAIYRALRLFGRFAWNRKQIRRQDEIQRKALQPHLAKGTAN